MACLDNNRFSLILNGKAIGFFKSEKGVRQGDPLSPALFILAEEYLLRGLQMLYSAFLALAYKSGGRMPTQVHQQIERIFNKFLWDGTPWCKWSVACAPFEEGGLNLISLQDIHTTFMHKAWLRLREGKCLWSQFMLDKYCRKHHPRLAPVHPAHSRVWKNLHKVRDSAEDMIRWQLGEGVSLYDVLREGVNKD
ncbi:hypothetical protein LIER_28970 [Lithospermum erythrorhizon]|uniref:Reverse transcriptase domain-containing protein n=1 Tax=Lithospermum erythrorhizon TaxID=34254 RepID=A0AAV3RHJ7_LITER